MDYLIVILIVLLACGYLIRRFVKNKGQGVSSACDACPTDCIGKETGESKKE